MNEKIKIKRPDKYDWDGFTINIYLDEDGEWLAHLVELPNVSAFADTPESALDELYVAWEGMKDCYHDDGEEIPIAPSRKEYSGQFNVRIDKRIHSLFFFLLKFTGYFRENNKYKYPYK